MIQPKSTDFHKGWNTESSAVPDTINPPKKGGGEKEEIKGTLTGISASSNNCK